MRVDFDLSIGQLDRLLSIFVALGRQWADGSPERNGLDSSDRQTLKHHAEDMILAGRKILKDLGEKEPQ